MSDTNIVETYRGESIHLVWHQRDRRWHATVRGMQHEGISDANYERALSYAEGFIDGVKSGAIRVCEETPAAEVAAEPAKEPACPPHRHEGDPTVRPCDAHNVEAIRDLRWTRGVRGSLVALSRFGTYQIRPTKEGYDLFLLNTRRPGRGAARLLTAQKKLGDAKKAATYFETERSAQVDAVLEPAFEYGASETATVLYEPRSTKTPRKKALSPAPKSGADDCTVCRPFTVLRYDEARRNVCMKRASEIGPIDNPIALGRLIRDDITSHTVETFVVVCTSLHGELRAIAEVHRGTRDGVEVASEDVMAIAIPTGTSNVFVAHAHPSGKPKPSKADVSLLHSLDKAFKPMSRLTFCDHVVITPGHVHSIREDKTYKLP